MLAEMDRIPPERFLACDNLDFYITPPLFSAFHDEEDREAFSIWVHENRARVSIAPDGEFAYSAQDYERWLETR